MIPKTDWLCVLGVCPDLFEKLQSWLEEEKKRRLIFLDLEGKGEIFSHLQVKVYSASTDEELLEIGKKLGWKSVFQTATVIDLLGSTERLQQFEKVFFEHQEAAHLLISDWADGGESVMKHALSHWGSLPDVRSALQMKDCFRGIPAVICGAGPSLEKNGHLLDRNKALIFAGGAALHRLSIEPHFAASIDREGPFESFKRQPFWQTIFLYQSRMNPENFSLLHGEKLYVPDGCHPAEAWISGEDLFDGGWTVGTFLASQALYFGCDPIIYVGMDLCYKQEQKYAFSDPLATPEKGVEVTTDSGEKVFTQRDWLMAASWISELAVRRWDRTFINATEGGLGFAPKVQERRLQDVFQELSGELDLEGKVHAETMARNFMPIPLERIEVWKKSLKRCLALCKKTLKKSDFPKWEQEIVYQKLLFPLWQVWGPIFERELETDLQPVSFEEKLRLNQILFFEQVLNEQAN